MATWSKNFPFFLSDLGVGCVVFHSRCHQLPMVLSAESLTTLWLNAKKISTGWYLIWSETRDLWAKRVTGHRFMHGKKRTTLVASTTIHFLQIWSLLTEGTRGWHSFSQLPPPIKRRFIHSLMTYFTLSSSWIPPFFRMYILDFRSILDIDLELPLWTFWFKHLDLLPVCHGVKLCIPWRSQYIQQPITVWSRIAQFSCCIFQARFYHMVTNSLLDKMEQGR